MVSKNSVHMYGHIVAKINKDAENTTINAVHDAVPWHISEIRHSFAKLLSYGDINACLLLLRVVCNRQQMFALEALEWLPLLLDFIVILEQSALGGSSNFLFTIFVDVVKLFAEVDPVVVATSQSTEAQTPKFFWEIV